MPNTDLPPVLPRCASPLVLLEHVNLTQPDQQLATLFYVVGLGFTRDPFLMVGLDNMWVQHRPHADAFAHEGTAATARPHRPDGPMAATTPGSAGATARVTDPHGF